jgi:hypothetical protein
MRRSHRFAERIFERRARFQRVGEAGADGEAITMIRVAEAEIGADLSRQLQTSGVP